MGASWLSAATTVGEFRAITSGRATQKCDWNPITVSFRSFGTDVHFTLSAAAGADDAAEAVSPNSDFLYFGSEIYPWIWSLPIWFTTSCTGCGRSSRLIQIGSKRLMLFFCIWLSSTNIARSYDLRL